ncbi:chaperone NapD (plasmid) [Nitrobacteraceae bacterium UC4446_H13]
MSDALELASVHISSAVISVLPLRRDEIARFIVTIPGIEIHYQTDSKLVIVIEALNSGAIGERLTQIGNLSGVLSANMVFEQIDRPEDTSQ